MKPQAVFSKLNNDREDKSPIPFINYNEPAPKRCISMLLAKYYDEEYVSEVKMVAPTKVEKPTIQVPLSQARILLLTDGGLVPRGNPDNIPPTNAKTFGVYYFGRNSYLRADDYEITHQGYDHKDIDINPNRLLPIDILVSLERERIIKEILPYFISTTGVMTTSGVARRMGRHIAKFVQNRPVDAVMIVSTCATSTRCGSYIGVELEKKGIPVVQITNLTAIASNIGIHRVVKGASVDCPIGNAKISPENEWSYREKIVKLALQTLMQ